MNTTNITFNAKDLQTLSSVLSESNNPDAGRMFQIIDNALNKLYDLDVIESKSFTLEKQIFDDGANPQAQAVLVWLRSLLFRINDLSYSYPVDDADVKCVRYKNCREQGYIVSLYTGADITFHYAFYEHRNSDSIIIVKFTKEGEDAGDTPIAEDVWNSMDDKYDYDMAFGYGDIVKAADWIMDDMIKELKRTFPKPDEED